MKRTVLVALGVVVLGVFAWIGWPRDAAPTVVGPSTESSTEASTGVGQPGAQVGEAVGEDDVSGPGAAGEITTGGPAPTVSAEPEFDATAPASAAPAVWDDDVRAAARAAALAAMAAFADVGQTPQEWWAELEQHLTPQARPVYQDVDPRLVPVREVTGEAVVVDESSTLLTQVTVPTDVGDYTVVLARADGASPWLAEQLRPPEAGASASSPGAEDR